MSYCKMPFEMGEPAYVSYGPSSAVDAVGIGATSKELRTPCRAIFAFSAAQS
eukprot:CAMPEP_0179903642 /NCGR_PEP_ID=MMETSP0982-20121206/41398_1 /TAXON_ID=483367 /ORGANISM="non described non described, Strain CCMP 2436" /LENGTH=51 /DNA_ID=CAMNT_0021803253 /DNA_START=748 /DNA_END=903 /DNA_ORIENTATION=+